MQNNILILINPYYEPDVIEKHLAILIEHSKVAFGKVKSKVNQNAIHPEEKELEALYESTSQEKYMQLFITDYASIYALKITEVANDVEAIYKPAYYESLDVEKWFVVEDMREIIRNDFAKTRDLVLSNFTTPQFNNHTFIVYGNRYHYPIIVNQKESIDYFLNDQEEFRYYTSMFKTPEQLQMRENLIYFGIGEKRFNQFSPNTGDNLINAELEFKANHHNSLYDFTSVILKYTKSFEYEIYQLIKKLFTILIKHDPKIATIPFSLNGLQRDAASLLTSKANLGSYLFLLKNEQIKHAIDGAIQNFTVKKFITNSLPFFIKSVQEMRNENVHGKPATLTDAKELRAEMIGVGKMSMLVEIVKNKEKMDKK